MPKYEICGGENPYKKDFINVDMAESPNVHLTADITKPLPIEDNTAEEIFSCATLEHLTFQEAVALLKEFLRIMQPGAMLTIAVPDLRNICAAYVAGVMSFRMVNQYLYGAQSDEYDFHKICFDFVNMKGLLEWLGFTDVVQVEYDLPMHIKQYMFKLTCNKPYENKSLETTKS